MRTALVPLACLVLAPLPTSAPSGETAGPARGVRASRPSITLDAPIVAGSSISGGGTLDKSDGKLVSITLFAAQDDPAGGALYSTKLMPESGGAEWGTGIANEPVGLPKGSYSVWAELVVTVGGKEARVASKTHRSVSVLVGMNQPRPPVTLIWREGRPPTLAASDGGAAISAEALAIAPDGYTVDSVTISAVAPDSGGDGAHGGAIRSAPMKRDAAHPKYWSVKSWNVGEVLAVGSKYQLSVAAVLKKDGAALYYTSPNASLVVK